MIAHYSTISLTIARILQISKTQHQLVEMSYNNTVQHLFMSCFKETHVCMCLEFWKANINCRTVGITKAREDGGKRCIRFWEPYYQRCEVIQSYTG